MSTMLVELYDALNEAGASEAKARAAAKSLAQPDERLERIERNLTGLSGETGGVRSEVGGMRGEIGGLREGQRRNCGSSEGNT
jgi:hypothetical protein